VLFLVFTLDGDRYALDVDQLVEVLPLVNLKPLAKAQPGIAGLFDFHGLPIPALDLSALIVARSALRRLSTRIVVVNYPGKNDTQHPLGLIAEKATTTVRLDPGAFKDVGVDDGETPYLGPVARDAAGLIQWLLIPKLLPLSIRNVLFQN
jgi:chemotaxis signal transduction protein